MGSAKARKMLAIFLASLLEEGQGDGNTSVDSDIYFL
jgi:hypothetical protein